MGIEARRVKNRKNCKIYVSLPNLLEVFHVNAKKERKAKCIYETGPWDMTGATSTLGVESDDCVVLVSYVPSTRVVRSFHLSSLNNTRPQLQSWPSTHHAEPPLPSPIPHIPHRKPLNGTATASNKPGTTPPHPARSTPAAPHPPRPLPKPSPPGPGPPGPPTRHTHPQPRCPRVRAAAALRREVSGHDAQPSQARRRGICGAELHRAPGGVELLLR